MPSDQLLWQSFKKLTGYDAADSRSVLRHALGAWSFWHECSSANLKSHRQFRASALALARRALRGWRRWTMRTRLFTPNMAAMQDPASVAPASACQEPPSPSAAPPSLALSRVWQQVLERKVYAPVYSFPGTPFQTPRRVVGHPPRPAPGALHPRSRSAMASVVAEQQVFQHHD